MILEPDHFVELPKSAIDVQSRRLILSSCPDAKADSGLGVFVLVGTQHQ